MSSNSDNLTDDEMLFMHNQISCNWCGVTPDEPKGFAYWACDKGGRGDSHEKEYFCMDCTKEIKIMHDGERVCPTCSFYDEFPWRDTPPLNPINMDLIEFFKQPNEDGTYDAETKKRKLSKTSCCCGATKAHPCLCMIQGNMKCAAKSPMCPCYKEIAMGIKVEMEHTKSKEKAEKIAKEHLAEHPDYYSRLKKAGLGAESWLTEGKCAMCNSPSKFTASTAIGERSFCCEACYAEYMGLPIEEEGYYGLASETFEAAVVSRSVPKTPLKKAMLNKAMMDKAEIEEAILDLETRVRLGLISEEEVMRKLHHRFGSEEEFVSCPHCEGSGSIADPSTYLPATREDPAEVDSMECPYCEGSGEVPEDEADEIPAYDWDYYRPNPDDRWDNYDRHEGRYDSESPKGIGDLRAGDKNLAGANLAGANLSGANLIDTNLENAILSNANLKSANLSGANLKGARIDFANLNSANLSGANLENVYANRATFRKANFKGANLDKVNFRQADLRGANLEDVKLNFSYQFHSFGGAELIDVIGLTDENKKLIAQDKGIFSEKDWDDYYGNHAEEEGSKAFMVAGITILSALSFGIYKRWKS